jgi:hypothetical protein
VRRAKKRVNRVVYGVFVTLAAAFIISNVAQIAMQVFSTKGSGRLPTPTCAAGLRELTAAVDRGLAAAAAAPNADDAERRYAQAKAPEWNRRTEIEHTCTEDAVGTDAMAAVTRLDRAAQGVVRKGATELAPVRREVDSFIR